MALVFIGQVIQTIAERLGVPLLAVQWVDGPTLLWMRQMVDSVKEGEE